LNFSRLANYENVRNNKAEDFDAEERDARLRSLIIELSVETEQLLGTGPP